MGVQRKHRILFGSAILLALLLVAILASHLPNQSRGASLTYMGSKLYPGGATAQFLASNEMDRAALVYISGLEEYSNGVWSLRREAAVSPKKLLPQQSLILSLKAPTNVEKWRLRVAVMAERHGLASVVARVKWFVGQARDLFRGKMQFPTGKIYDGNDLISEEITKT